MLKIGQIPFMKQKSTIVLSLFELPLLIIILVSIRITGSVHRVLREVMSCGRHLSHRADFIRRR